MNRLEKAFNTFIVWLAILAIFLIIVAGFMAELGFRWTF